jgi:membrane dipeptidase
MKSIRIVDLHADFPHQVIKKRPAGEHRVLERYFAKLLRQGSVGTVIAPIWLTPEHKPNGLKRGLQIADAFLEDLEESRSFELVRNYNELLDAERKRKIGLIMGCEGGEIIEDDIHLLHVYYRLGLRVFGFMWNQRNLLADGWDHANDDRGLSDFGKKVVEEVERMHVLIDLAHMAPKGWWDIMDMAKKPLIVSHTTTRGPPNASDRAMTDDQLRAVADNGGVVGIIAVYSQKTKGVPDLQAYCDHVEYVAKVAGPEHAALGPDLGYWFFENGVPETFAGWTDWRMTKDLEDHSKVRDVLRELSRRGMSDKEIKLIARDNFVRVFKKVVG